MTTEEAAAIRAFLREAGRLKDTLRSGFTPAGRPESVAEHSWRLALAALVAAPPGLDLAKALGLCLVHDLGEAISGDVPAIVETDAAEKEARERADLATLLRPAPEAVRARVAALWEEYAATETPEARFVRGLDKIETVATHAEGANPPDFDYAFNLGYGRARTAADPTAAALRAVVDVETRRLAGASARIRAGVEADVPACAAVSVRCAAQFSDGPRAAVAERPPPDPSAELAEAARGGLLLVAEAPAGVVGHLRTVPEAASLAIAAVDVDPSHQRLGIARRLIDGAEAAARDRGVAALTLTTFSDVAWNAPLYRRLGFVEVPRAEWTPRAVAETEGMAARGHDVSTRVAMRRPVRSRG